MFSVASWRVKETERMIAICTELRKVNFVMHHYFSISQALHVFSKILLVTLIHTFPTISVRGYSWRRARLLIITPPEKLNVTSIDTYDDHRMAMAFSLAACADVPVTIKDPGCTRKTFPDYFDVLEKFSKHWINFLERYVASHKECEQF